MSDATRSEHAIVWQEKKCHTKPSDRDWIGQKQWTLSGLPFGLTQGQISQIWPFLIALGLDIFGLAFWLYFWPFWRVWPWRLLFGLNVIFWLYFGLFYTTIPFNYHKVTELPPTPLLPLPYAHSLTNGYLLNCQSQCPVTWHDVTNMSLVSVYWQFFVVNANSMDSITSVKL